MVRFCQAPWSKNTLPTAYLTAATETEVKRGAAAATATRRRRQRRTTSGLCALCTFDYGYVKRLSREWDIHKMYQNVSKCVDLLMVGVA